MDQSNSVQEALAPVKKSVLVKLPVEAAFHLFTADMHRWWPLLTHSMGAEEAETCRVEAWVGGRVYEVLKDGRQEEWGRVLVWEPPHRLVYSWYVGRTAETGQRLEITFTSEGSGARVELAHYDWALLGEQAQSMRLNYDRGWDAVLRDFATAAGQEPDPPA